MSTKEIFERLLEIVREKKPDQFEYLGKGLSRAEIESKIKTHPIPEALIDIYGCVSGLPDIDTPYFLIFLDWNLLYIDDVNKTIDRLEEGNLTMVNFFPDYKLGMYSNHMIPFAYDGSGNFMCVKNLPNDQSVWDIPKSDEPHMVYLSIDHFLLTTIACYEREAYFWDEEEEYWDNDVGFELQIEEEIRQSLENRSSESP